MSSLPESLLRFRTELEDAIRRELEAQATARSNGWGARLLGAVRRRPGRTTLAFATLAVATSVAFFVSTPWQSSPGFGFLEPAQAARFLERTRAAFTPPRGKVLHFKVVVASTFGSSCTVTQPPVEYWFDKRPPYKYRAFEVNQPDLCKAGTSIEIGGEAASRNALVFRAPNTLATMPRWATIPATGPDPVANLRQAIGDGTAQHAGRTVLDGRTVERIRFDCNPSTFPTCDRVVAYVDPKNLHPVRVESGGGRFSVDYVKYEYLSGTPANRRLADIRAQHPDATPVARTEQP